MAINHPPALTKALELANESTWKPIGYESVWIERPIAADLEPNEFQVRYIIGGETGAIANSTLRLTEDQIKEYRSWLNTVRSTLSDEDRHVLETYASWLQA